MGGVRHDRKLTQQLFACDAPPAAQSPLSPVVLPRHIVSDEEPRTALDQLEDWLIDPRTGKLVTKLAEEAVHAVRKTLVEGKNAYVQTAEDWLEAVALRNSRTSGEDIPPVPVPDGPDFQQTIDDLLTERVTARWR